MELVAPIQMSLTGCGIVLKDVISLDDANKNGSPDSIVITSDSSKDESICSNEDSRLLNDTHPDRQTEAEEPSVEPTTCVDISQDSSEDESPDKGRGETVDILSDTDSVNGEDVAESNSTKESVVPWTSNSIPKAASTEPNTHQNVMIIPSEKPPGKRVKVLLPKKRNMDMVVTPIKSSLPITKECVECNKDTACFYTIDIGGVTCYLCSEKCVLENKCSLNNVLQSILTRENSCVEARVCSSCDSKIVPNENTFSWETMDFCQESCLKTYQDSLGQACSFCKKQCSKQSLGKYCVRFGFEIRQFCQTSCLEEFKKVLKVCLYCQEDLTFSSAPLKAIVGKDPLEKDFCSETCIKNYDKMSRSISLQLSANICNVCKKFKVAAVEVIKGTELFHFCSEVCFSAFKFVHPISIGFCYVCKKYFDQKSIPEKYAIFHDGVQNSFCSKACVNYFVFTRRKIVQCNWCKVKKYNFDMIKKVFSNKQVLMFCSFNCFTLWKRSPKRNTCDHCNTFGSIMYHLGMSDGTLRSFCGHDCLMKFQLQFKKIPVTPSAARPISPVYSTSPKPTPKQVLAVNNSDSPVVHAQPILPKSTLPIISSVATLDPETSLPYPDQPPQPPTLVTQPQPARKQVTVHPSAAPQMLVKHQILIAPPHCVEMCNKITMCDLTSGISGAKSTNCSTTSCQTDNESVDSEKQEDKETTVSTTEETTSTSSPKETANGFILPIPVFIPVPVPIYNTPVLTPLPLPIPVGIPILVSKDRQLDNELDAGGDDEMNDDDSSTSAVKRNFSSTHETIDGGEEGVTKKRKIDNSSKGGTSANSSSGASNDRSGGSEEGGSSGGGFPPPGPDHNLQNRCPASKKYLKHMYGVNAWKQWVAKKNEAILKGEEIRRSRPFPPDLLQLTSQDLCQSLCWFIKEFKKPSGEEYTADIIYYLCLGVQDYLQANGRVDNIFTDIYYEEFTDSLDSVISLFHEGSINELVVPRIEEEHLWESMQLGPYSPYAVILSLMYFNTKYFLLKTVDAHVKLTFSQIMKHWKRNQSDGTKTTLLRYYPPLLPNATSDGSKDTNLEDKRFEQAEDTSNPLRCPVKLYEFYLSKCCEGISSRNDVFYLMPERSCIPDSPVWYSSQPLDKQVISKMFNRLKLVKEINLAISD